MKQILSIAALALLLAVGLLEVKHAFKSAPLASETFLQKEMDAYCATKLNDSYLSKLSPDERKGLSGAANITSQIGRNGVVPLRQYLIGFKSKR